MLRYKFVAIALVALLAAGNAGAAFARDGQHKAARHAQGYSQMQRGDAARMRTAPRQARRNTYTHSYSPSESYSSGDIYGYGPNDTKAGPNFGSLQWWESNHWFDPDS